MTDTTSPKLHSTPITLIGAGVGAAVGWGIRPETKALSPLKSGSTAAAMLVGGVLGGLAGWFASSSKNPNYSPPVPNLPPGPGPNVLQPVSGGGGTTLTVSPGLSVQTVPLEVQDQVVIRLPSQGAQWQSMDGAPIADRTSPIAFTFLGPISHTLVWFDERNQQYSSTYFFVVNPNVPTVNA